LNRIWPKVKLLLTPNLIKILSNSIIIKPNIRNLYGKIRENYNKVSKHHLSEDPNFFPAACREKSKEKGKLLPITTTINPHNQIHALFGAPC